MRRSESTLVYKSNVYPILENDLKEDKEFLMQIHDPFALKELEKIRYIRTPIQEKEYKCASGHCAYAYKDDYPWGTITCEDGSKVVACKCTNIDCAIFKKCRPDFDVSELDVYKENKEVQPATFSAIQSFQPVSNANNMDFDMVRNIFEEGSESVSLDSEKLISFYEEQAMEFTEDSIAQPSMLVVDEIVQSQKNINFMSFVESTQKQIIDYDASARIIIDAGPGTGKTWTLIEKIINMLNRGDAAAEEILVLCFSRSAVEVIKNRLFTAAKDERIDYTWRDIDIRTFDSFSTYMLAWAQKENPNLLPEIFNLDNCDYEQRIQQATSILIEQKDMLTNYRQIIVDEVQDLVGSRAQLVLALLKGLPSTCGFTLLGDSCQSLYDYLAVGEVVSSEKFYQEIFDNFPTAYYYTLTENHRQCNELGAMTIPYRMSILAGTSSERCSAASNLLEEISSSNIRLQTFSKKTAAEYTKNGTLGILTRTNGQALQISAWLRNEDVSHVLLRGTSKSEFADWISRIFMDWENETMDENSFVQKHVKIFPELQNEKARERWVALVNAQREGNKLRFEIRDLLYGLLCNACDSELYKSNGVKNCAITVSNIHKAKGQEFDSVIVIDDVISAMTDAEKDDILEHKVCYVALTRFKKTIERVFLTNQYIYIEPNEFRRCSKASLTYGGKKKYISHFEVGGDYDINPVSFAENIERQKYIKNELQPGMRLKLKKCPQNTNDFVTYSIVVEDKEHIILGYTGKEFASELNSSIQRILKITFNINYEVFPHAFCDVYVADIISCVSSIYSPEGARKYGDMSIWIGFTMTGFAAVDKDTY